MIGKIRFGLAACAAVLGVTVAETAAAPAAVSAATGTITIQVSLDAGPRMPDGSTLSFSPSIFLYDATFNYSVGLSPPNTKVSGRKGVLTIRIPYKWMVASRSDQMNVSLSVYGYARDGSSDSTTFNAAFALPANGTNKVLSFTGSI